MGNPLRNGCQIMADIDTDKELTTNSPCLVGGASVTREQAPNTPAEPENDRWLCAMRRTVTTVTLLDYTPEPVAAVLKSKPWARLVKGLGWSFPAKYLAHVERLLDGASVDLFDVDGDLTPAQAARKRALDHADTARVVGELRAARDAAEADPAAVERAKREAKEAFAQAIEAKRQRSAS